MDNDPTRLPDEFYRTQEFVDLSEPMGGSREAWVEVIRGRDEGRRAAVGARLFRVGTDPLCDLVLTDPTISRRHCELKLTTDGYMLRDLDSTNGTFVDELRLGEIFLEPGVFIKVGKSLLRFQVRSEEREESGRFDSLAKTIVGSSKEIIEVFDQVLRIAPTDLSVVIEGETGTGKELIARAIHLHSLRQENPFVVFDCSAFPSSLIESELFGHEKGAFTSAVDVHSGVFERADHGTLFMDELGEMDVEYQAKFLRSLESGEIRRIGGEETFHVDVRVITATNQDLESLTEQGRFRQDLFYRLAKVRLKLPPLRERTCDILPLAERFLDTSRIPGRPRPTITPAAIDVLGKHSWPGNIRELRNIVERASALCEGGRITGEFIRGELTTKRAKSATPWAVPIVHDGQVELLPGISETVPLKEAKQRIVDDFELLYLIRLLDKHKNNVSRAAREAQIDRRHFYRLMKKHELMETDKS